MFDRADIAMALVKTGGVKWWEPVLSVHYDYSSRTSSIGGLKNSSRIEPESGTRMVNRFMAA